MAKTPKRIYVVDDNPSLQKIAKKILERNGFEVTPVWCGDECLKMVRADRPDAILMDVMLPDGNGKDFVRELEKDEATRGIAIVFTTNTIDLGDDKGFEVFEIDGTQYRAFAKPLHDRKVAAALRKEINRKLFGGNLSEKSRVNRGLGTDKPDTK